MEGEFTIWQTRNGVQPPALVPLIGCKVRRAWLSPTGKALFVRLDSDDVVLAEPEEDIGGQHALKLSMGRAEPDKDWDALDREMPEQSPYLVALRGRPFTGLDKNVLAFGDVGAQILKEGVRWVLLVAKDDGEQRGQVQ